MANYVGLRALHRRGVRIGGKLVSPTETTYVDVDNTTTRRDLQRHSALGAVTVVETGANAYTVATLPAANTFPAGTIVYVSDGGAGAVFRGSTVSAWVNLG